MQLINITLKVLIAKGQHSPKGFVSGGSHILPISGLPWDIASSKRLSLITITSLPYSGFSMIPHRAFYVFTVISLYCQYLFLIFSPQEYKGNSTLQYQDSVWGQNKKNCYEHHLIQRTRIHGKFFTWSAYNTSCLTLECVVTFLSPSCLKWKRLLQWINEDQ